MAATAKTRHIVRGERTTKTGAPVSLFTDHATGRVWINDYYDRKIAWGQLSDDWVYSVGVDEDHRRQGLGTILMEGIIALAREFEVKTLYLNASNDGYPLYLTLGFELVNDEPFYYNAPMKLVLGDEEEKKRAPRTYHADGIITVQGTGSSYRADGISVHFYLPVTYTALEDENGECAECEAEMLLGSTYVHPGYNDWKDREHNTLKLEWYSVEKQFDPAIYLPWMIDFTIERIKASPLADFKRIVISDPDHYRVFIEAGFSRIEPGHRAMELVL